jgi:transposase
MIADQDATLIADNGYDADPVREAVAERGRMGEHPAQSHRKTPICFSKYLDRARNLGKRFSHKIKHFRRIATRYDKLATRFAAAVALVGAILWWS